ncbi:hypothetical protein [Aeromonas veronii]|uniref:hypothetical protein n=1 Tax=Aeromonas veronii TaxID=654 RepID=UPI002B4A4039|nr:hypothetical protein [Aeromonas veronii]
MKSHKNAVIFLSSLIFVSSLLYTYILDFSYPVDIEVLVASILDWLFTVLIIALVMRMYPTRFLYLYNHFNFSVRCVLNENMVLISVLTFIAMCFAYSRLNFILAGATREDLVFGNTSNRLMSLISPIIVFVCAYSVVFSSKAINIAFLLLGVVAIGVYNLSRSEFSNLIFIMLAFTVIKKISLRQALFFVFFFFVIIVFVTIMTIYQGRAQSLATSLMGVLHAFFKYKSFAFYLSEYAIDKVNGDVEHVLYPFFGFIIERFLSVIELISNPISVQDSSFITDFHSLGPSTEYDANVLYPWWSWFYGCFGIVGILLKAIYVFCILVVVVRTRFAFTSIYFIYVMLFTSFYRHPLLNADSFFFLLAIILLDLFFLMKIKKPSLIH